MDKKEANEKRFTKSNLRQADIDGFENLVINSSKNLSGTDGRIHMDRSYSNQFNTANGNNSSKSFAGNSGRTYMARSCFNGNSSIARPKGLSRSVINASNPFLSRPDVSWTDEERQKHMEKKRLLSKYKTSLCIDFVDLGNCSRGKECRFAHGVEELRPKPQPKNVKTVLCVKFEEFGVCPYAGRCLFIHRNKTLNTSWINDSNN